MNIHNVIEKKSSTIKASSQIPTYLTNNEAAFHFWKNILKEPNFVGPRYHMIVTFNYKTSLERSFLDAIFQRWPTATNQFTTSNLFGVTIIEKGNEVNHLPIDKSVLWLHVGTKDERRFYGIPNLFRKCDVGVPCTVTSERGMCSHIEILFSDIISICFTEV